MTVSSQVSRTTAVWTGGDVWIPTGLLAIDAADISVTYAGPSGPMALTRGTHFTARLSPADSVTAAPAEIRPIAATLPAAPLTFTFTRRTPAVQPLDLETGYFDPQALERRLDAGALLDQEQGRQIDDLAARAVTVREGQTPPQIDVAPFLGVGGLVGLDAGGAAVRIPAGTPGAAIASTQIIDSTAPGRALLTANTPALQRTALSSPSVAEMNAADAAGAAVAAAALQSVDLRERRARLRALRNSDSSRALSGLTAMYEVGALFPGIYPWQNSSNVAAPITQQFIEETIDVHADIGIERLILVTGVEKFGFCLYPFGFPAWFDEQNGRLLQNWQNASPPGWIPMADAVTIMLERLHRNAMRLVAGPGKCGDDYLTVDLALPGASVSGLTSAALAAKSKATRQADAILRQCQMGADIFAQFGQHPAFAGFYIAPEPDSIDACTALIKGIAQDGAGGFPGLNSYRLADRSPVEVWVSPADMDDFPAANASRAVWEAKAAQVRSWGVTHWAPQDVVGSGEDINGIPTWNPANRLSMLRGYVGQHRRLLDIVNCPGLANGRYVEMVVNNEGFQMDGPNYDNAYAPAFSRMIDQIAKSADQAGPPLIYGIMPFAMPSRLSRRLPVSFNGKVDFRARSDAFNAGMEQIAAGAARRALQPGAMPREVSIEDAATRTAPANATTAFTIGTFYPRFEIARSRVEILLWVQRAYAAGVTSADVTLFPQVNGVNVPLRGGLVGFTGALLAGPITLTFEHAHDGQPFEVGWVATVLAGSPAFVVTYAEARMTEIRK